MPRNSRRKGRTRASSKKVGTVAQRIGDITEDIEMQLLERINTLPWYALQVEESTDIDNKAMFLIYVRYVHQEEVHEDMLCVLSLPNKTTATELFKSLNDYISRKLKWSYCVGICTDRATAMTGHLTSLVARVKEVAPKCESTHCIIHREMLATRKMLLDLKSVLDDVVKIINYCTSRHGLLTRDCLSNYVKRWTKSTSIFSYSQK